MLREIGRVAVFIICAQTLLHFRAKESYERYIKLLISMMVLMLLLKPFFSGKFGTESDFLEQMIAKHEKELEENVFSMEMNQEKVEEIVMSMSMEAVAQKEMQDLEKQQEEAETKERKGEDQSIIHVEEIQIGD